MSTANGHVQVVTFRLGGDLFAADIHGVERVLRRQEPTPVPNVPDWIVGVIEYQKRVVPVIDMRARFELDASAATNETRVLVFNADNQWVAGVVDSVLDVAAIDKTNLQPPPPLFRGLAGEYLKGIVRRDNKLVMLLDVSKLLTATERLALELVDA
jgi:purine-binding chemotaxis protein CheW